MLRFREWLRSIDWVPILASALFLVLVLWFIDTNPGNKNNPDAYQNPFQYIVGMLSPEGWTALGTIVLAGSTLLLWSVTRTAANAAKNAADMLPIVERAYVYPVVTNPGAINECLREASIYFLDDPTKADTPIKTTSELTFRLKNYGKTPAVVKEVFAGFGVYPLGAQIGIVVQERILGTSEGTEALYATMERGFTQNESVHILTCTKHIAFVGQILFEDIWNNEFRTEFYFEWEPGSGRMQLSGLSTKRTKQK